MRACLWTERKGGRRGPVGRAQSRPHTLHLVLGMVTASILRVGTCPGQDYWKQTMISDLAQPPPPPDCPSSCSR
jgi:hypothetical protein